MTTAATHAAEAPSLFFGDARACRAWLAELPVAQLAQSQSTLLDALRVFNRTTFDPLERLKCLELLRDRIAFVLAEQRGRTLAKGLPLAPGDLAAWTNARTLLEEMEAGYRRCAREAGLEPHAALIAQRVVRSIGAQMMLEALVYRPVEDAAWARLHQQYAAAQSAGLADAAVKDSLESEAGSSSVTEAYARAVLMNTAPLCEMTHAQIAFTEAVLRLWARKVTVGGPVAVDTGAARPAAMDIEGVLRSVRRRVGALQAGEDVASLGLPAEAGAVDPLPLLKRLAAGWTGPARETRGEVPREGTAGLVFGATAIHLFLSGGKPFVAPGEERELSHQEKEDIAVFGRVTQRTQGMMAAAQVPTVEPWSVVEEGTGWLRLRRRSDATHPVAVGRLVAARLGDAGPFFLGTIRELCDAPQGFVARVALFPGRPEPAAVRGAKSPWAPGFVLPALEKVGVPMSLVVPAGVAFRGRTIAFWNEGPVEAKAGEMLDRGADYDRVTLA